MALRRGGYYALVQHCRVLSEITEYPEASVMLSFAQARA